MLVSKQSLEETLCLHSVERMQQTDMWKKDYLLRMWHSRMSTKNSGRVQRGRMSKTILLECESNTGEEFSRSQSIEAGGSGVGWALEPGLAIPLHPSLPIKLTHTAKPSNDDHDCSLLCQTGVSSGPGQYFLYACSWHQAQHGLRQRGPPWTSTCAWCT